MGDDAPEGACPSCGSEWGTSLSGSLSSLNSPVTPAAAAPAPGRRFPRAFWLGLLLVAGAVMLMGGGAFRMRLLARAAAQQAGRETTREPQRDELTDAQQQLALLRDDLRELQAGLAQRDAELRRSEADRVSAEERYVATLENLQRVQDELDQLRVEYEFLHDTREQTFVRTWQILGPLVNDEDKGRGDPSGRKVNLSRSYAGVSGEAQWRACEIETDKLDFSAVLKSRDKAVALAACWVHCRDKRGVKLSIGSDDGVRVWVNQELVHEHRVQRAGAPGQDSAEATFQPGWNEILVEVDNIGSGEWCLFFEFRTPDENQPLKLACTNQAPSTGRGRAVR